MNSGAARARPGPPAILIGRNCGHGALSAARSLGAMGIAVDLLTGGSPTVPVQFSRHVRSCTDFALGPDLAERWLHWLTSSAEPSVLLPCYDDGVELIARHRSALLAAGHLPAESDDRVSLAMLDKDRTYCLARGIDVPAPVSVTVKQPDDIDAAIQAIELPCMVKPLHSHLFRQRFPLLNKGAIVHSTSELREMLTFTTDSGEPMLATELVPGPPDAFVSYYSYIDDRGEPLFHFTKRKLRQYPAGVGLGSFHVTKWDPEVAEAGLDFLQGVGLRGVGVVEFKRDSRDGTLKLIECNARFTEAIELARRAGLDLPRLSYSRLTGGDGAVPSSHRDGLALWLPVNDFRAFLQYRRQGELSTRAWLESLLEYRITPALFDWGDPLPALWSGPQRAGRVLRRAARQLAEVRGPAPAPRPRVPPGAGPEPESEPFAQSR